MVGIRNAKGYAVDESVRLPKGALMSNFKLSNTTIEGLVIIEPKVHHDNRGYFLESYNERSFEEIGLHAHFVQDNESLSARGVLRGLHFQINHPQGKLVRVSHGSVFDVAVDMRPQSKSYGRWFGIELSSENKKQLFIPEGFAHGFLTLSNTAVVCYKTTDYYWPGDEGADPTLSIKWPINYGLINCNNQDSKTCCRESELIISEKDQHWPLWRCKTVVFI